MVFGQFTRVEVRNTASIVHHHFDNFFHNVFNGAHGSWVVHNFNYIARHDSGLQKTFFYQQQIRTTLAGSQINFLNVGYYPLLAFRMIKLLECILLLKGAVRTQNGPGCGDKVLCFVVVVIAVQICYKGGGDVGDFTVVAMVALIGDEDSGQRVGFIVLDKRFIHTVKNSRR